MARAKTLWAVAVAICATLALSGGEVWAAKKSNIRASKHNLSAVPDGTAVPGSGGTVPTRDVKAVAGQDSQNQVCVYCHTPHGATDAVTPLWNRQLSNAVYTGYTSKSLDAIDVQEGFNGQPDGSSKLCLSCHDGTIAVGAVNVLNGRTPASAVTMTGNNQSAGKIIDPPSGTAGYTRYIGTDLSNDHPISVAYTSTLAVRDGELRDVGASQKYPGTATGTAVIVGRRSATDKPKLPLEKTAADGTTGEIQCATCHDPHLVDDAEATVGNQKFLRLNRFQENQVVTDGAYPVDFDQANDIICLACHDKNIGGTGTWAASAHANNNVRSGTTTNDGTQYTYKTDAASLRGFPANQPVWKAACLNCHDTHTAPGARRLLRGGVSGGSSAIEETCYQCHNTAAASILNQNTAPNIKSDFDLTYRMPITNTTQAITPEVHDIGFSTGFGATGCLAATGSNDGCGKDFVEDQEILGTSRHAECTDCHNPHRVMKKQCFNGAAGAACNGTVDLVNPDGEGTHRHVNGTAHTNLASGALRGAWGVEPKYSGGKSFQTAVAKADYDVKRGDAGLSTAVSSTYVTREYQICLKCHSSYAYGTTPPLLATTAARGTTVTGTAAANGLVRYSDQAREFQPPDNHRGVVRPADGTAHAEGCEAGAWNGCGTAFPSGNNYNVENHRSWHPVIGPTGRDAGARGSVASNWLGPFAAAVGTQTMYCSDCHGSNTASGTVVPTTVSSVQNPWGPHGSANSFILKGPWGNGSAEICLKCHSSGAYQSASGGNTGFTTDSKGDGHAYHNEKVGSLRCYWCHVAVPHGWKNKALLVNLNDVGQEVNDGLGNPINPPIQVATNYTNPPYYYRAYLKIKNFRRSNTWSQSECGPRSGTAGKDWMTSNCTPSN